MQTCNLSYDVIRGCGLHRWDKVRCSREGTDNRKVNIKSLLGQKKVPQLNLS